MTDNEATNTPTLLDYLRVLRRRKWSFLFPVILVPLIAVGYTMRESPAYLSSAQVLLNQQSLAQSVSGLQSQYSDPARAAQTEAELARVQQVAQRTVKLAGVPNVTPTQLLKSSTVLASATSDFLTFSVTRPDAASAERLASAYARAYKDYRQSLDAQDLKSAEAAARQQLTELQAAGLKGSAAYQAWSAKLRQLSALEALQTSTTQVVQPADHAAQIGPRKVRNGAIGLTLGIVLGIVLAFLRDALDTRVRSVETIRKTLGLRLLGRLPAPPRDLRKEDSLVMFAAPMSHDAEPFRVLRTSFEFANADKQAKTIMVTSALDGEGKSTTAANLAIALARAGRSVVLVDFDLRKPYLHRFFDLGHEPGLIDVELGNVELEDALWEIPLTPPDASAATGGRPGRSTGTLEVLPAGQVVPDGDDELATGLAVARTIHKLRSRADIVLIDAAPILAVGDAIALTAYVDALIVVVRQNAIRSSSLDDLRRILSSSPAGKLGFVLTGAERDEAYHSYRQYGGGSGGGDDERQPEVPRPRSSLRREPVRTVNAAVVSPRISPGQDSPPRAGA